MFSSASVVEAEKRKVCYSITYTYIMIQLLHRNKIKFCEVTACEKNLYSLNQKTQLKQRLTSYLLDASKNG
jgi:hypothetical protein